MRNDNDDDYMVYEDTAPEAAAPAAPSDEQILAFVQANIDNPALIAETAAQYGVSVADLSRATGFGADAVVSYFEQHDVPPPAYTPPAVVEEVATETPAQAIARIQAEYDEKKRIANENLTALQVNKPVVEPPPPPPEKPVVEPPRPPERPVEEPPRRPDEPPPRPEPPRPQEPPEDLYSTWAQDQSGNPYTKQVVGPRTTYRQNADGSLTQLDERGDPIKVAETTTGTTTGATTAADTTPVTTTTTAPTTTTAATATTPATTTLAATTPTTLTDYQGNQFNGDQVLKLAQQISQNAGTMTGGAFKTKGESIGFDASEAAKLLGRPPTASEQVLLDMSRQMLLSGVDDLSKLQLQDIKSSGVSVQIDPDTNQYYALIPSADGETSTRKDLTPDQVAKIKTEEIYLGGDNGTQIQRTIDDLVTGKGLFANGKMLTAQDASDNPIAYTIGQTYTGGGGTNYELKFDPKTGKSVVSANGFTTSDADTIMPIIMIASNFLMPGAGSFLTSTLVEAGMSEFTSQIVSKAVLNGVTSGIMAEASGGSFGDGFLKGAVTGAVSAGVAPTIATALPSDLPPVVSNALTKAGTAFVTAVATGQDGADALGRSLLSSATTGGLGLVSGEIGLSGEEARLLTTTLAPVLTSLITNGNVDNSTLLNTVLMAGSTILANTGSEAINNVSTVTTGDSDDSSDSSLSGLNSVNNNTLNQLTSTSGADNVNGALTLMSGSGNETLTDLASTVGTGLGLASTANSLLNKATSLTKPVTKVDKTKANLTGALKTNKPTTKVAAVKPSALSTLNATKTAPVKPAALSTLNAVKASPVKPTALAKLTPIKTTSPPKKVDVSTLKPLTNVSGLTTLKPTPTGKG